MHITLWDCVRVYLSVCLYIIIIFVGSLGRWFNNQWVLRGPLSPFYHQRIRRHKCFGCPYTQIFNFLWDKTQLFMGYRHAFWTSGITPHLSILGRASGLVGPSCWCMQSRHTTDDLLVLNDWRPSILSVLIWNYPIRPALPSFSRYLIIPPPPLSHLWCGNDLKNV